MPIFKVIEGGLSANYNRFKDFQFAGCKATNTRLMGVVALYSEWLARDGSGKVMHILMHLDFSEYGIDDYRDFTHPSAKSASRDDDMSGCWDEISGNLGGEMVEIPLNTMMYLIDSAVSINEQYYEGHEDDILDFRREMLVKVKQLHEACDEDLSDMQALPEQEHIRSVCPRFLRTNETINYFIMRLIDKDYSALSYLSDIDRDELINNPLSKYGLMSLVRNRINFIGQDRESGCEGYKCLSLMLNENGYYYCEVTLALNGKGKDKNRTIVEMSFNSCMKISEFEAALQLRQSEYITVYSINGDPDDFDLSHSMLASKAAVSQMPNGEMYVLFNQDNSHVNTNDYYLNRDLYGAYLVTPQGELVLMSGEIRKINNMEMDLQVITLLEGIELVGRYHFTSQIFQTFAMTPGAVFDDVIYRPEDDD